MVLKVLLIEDHPLFRAGLRGVLEQVEAHTEVLESASFAAALPLIEADADIDLVLLDIHLPDVNGLVALKALRQQHPELPVAIVSASQDRDEVHTALRLGAAGFIPKASPSAVLQQALCLILSGGVYVPPHMLLDYAPVSDTAGRAEPGLSLADEERLSELGLTKRQVQVLGLMAQGDSNKQIARTLDVSEHTVKAHVTPILKALEVSSRAQAIAALSHKRALHS